MKHDFKPYPNRIFIETGSYEGDGIQAAIDSGNYDLIISIEFPELNFLIFPEDGSI